MKGTRFFIGVVLGIAVVLGGHYVGRSLCIIHTGRHHRIPVAANGQIPADEQEAHLTFGQGHEVTWQSTDKTKSLLIQFEKAKLPGGKDGNPPFTGMTESSDKKYWLADCHWGDICGSGAINDNLKNDLKGWPSCLKFEYDQKVGSQLKDGWIIIEK